jgi:predicted MFS family arabinose efflux permease
MAADEPSKDGSIFKVAEFRALFFANLVSVIGDQLARVALAVLVFNRTDSAAWTALTYAMTFLPDVAGGALLAGFADRFPRRLVMVTADVVRAGLVAVMAIPGQPIVSLVVLLVVVQLLAAPSMAARNAILPSILTGDRYVTGITIIRTSFQLGLIGGVGTGAAVVVALGTGQALLIDAATFVASSVVVFFGVRAHRPDSVDAATPKTWWRTVHAGFGLVWSDRGLRALIGLACVSGCYVIPEGLAVPYSSQIHSGTAGVGWLLGSVPAGMVIGMLILKRLPQATRLRLLGPLAVASCAVLLPIWWAPGLVGSVALWFASGFCSSYNMITNATFVQTVPDHSRGQAVGLANAALRVAQGLGIVIAGALTTLLTPGGVITLAAIAGVGLAAATALAWSRSVSPAPTVAGGDETGQASSSSA